MKQLKKNFIIYADSFLSGIEENDLMIKLKRDHCLEVAAVALELMQSVSNDKNDLLLAEISGLYHDIGRFVQYRKYRTFSDAQSENHSVLALNVIKEHNLLDFLPVNEQKLVCDTIMYHNQAKIPADLTEREALFAGMLRDADKIDIYRVVLYYYENPRKLDGVTLDLPDIPEISPEVLRSLIAREPVKMTELKSINDFKLCQLAWIYDLNLPHSKVIFGKREYLERMAAQLPQFPGKSEVITQLTNFLAS